MKDHSHHCFFTYSVKREPSIIFHVDIKHTLVRWFTLCGWRAGVLVATVWPGLVVCVLCPLLAPLGGLVGGGCMHPVLVLSGRFGDVRPDLKTVSGGEFDWGGTSVKS